MKFQVKVISISAVFACLAIAVNAQEVEQKAEEEKSETSTLVETNEVGILYEHGRSFGFVTHSNGLGLNFRSGKNTTGYTKRIFEYEVVTIKHAKEYKTFDQTQDSKGYIYGKSNALLALRASIGQQRIIAMKTDMGGIELRYIYMAGVSLGILKPVYLKIKKKDQNQRTYVVTEKYNPAVHGTNNIHGKAPVLRGMDELKLIPGGFAKFGLSFDYGTEPTKIRSLEVGVMLDAYYKKVPILADLNEEDNIDVNNMFFFGFYLSLNYGKRW